MNSNMNHLIKITMANLPRKENLSGEEILEAMVEAVAKENMICQELLEDAEKMNTFSAMVSGMIWDNIHRDSLL